MIYQATFDDNAVLTFEAADQSAALDVVADHGQWGDEFDLTYRRDLSCSFKIEPSRWAINYPASKGLSSPGLICYRRRAKRKDKHCEHTD